MKLLQFCVFLLIVPTILCSFECGNKYTLIYEKDGNELKINLPGIIF